MFDLWKKLTQTESRDAAHGVEPHRLAAAALLVEAAHMDGSMDAEELSSIRTLLAERFGLAAGDAQVLLDEGERAARESSDWQGFTSTIKEAFDQDGRIALVGMLWQVVLSDGVLHDHEASLMRRITGLLYVSGRESALARDEAKRTLGLSD